MKKWILSFAASVATLAVLWGGVWCSGWTPVRGGDLVVLYVTGVGLGGFAFSFAWAMAKLDE
jgi:hypothetical protein